MIVLLMQEYKILQDKIDKIGSFRFTIKGWAITLATGAALGALATSLSAKYATALVFGLLTAFWLLELRQLNLSDIFGDRARRIEVGIERRLRILGVPRSDFLGLVRIPGTANEIRIPPTTARFRVHFRNRTLLSSLGLLAGDDTAFKSALALGRRLKRSKSWRWFIKSDLYFYVIVLLAMWIFFSYQGSTNAPAQQHSKFLEISARDRESAVAPHEPKRRS